LTIYAFDYFAGKAKDPLASDWQANLSVHPPLGVLGILHDWLGEPVNTIVGCDVACDLPIFMSMKEKCPLATLS
jgi:hypothetical protein